MVNIESSIFFHCAYVGVAHTIAIQTKGIYLYSAHYVESLIQTTETIHILKEGLFLGLGSTLFICVPATLSQQLYTGQAHNLIEKSLFYFWAFQILYHFLSKLHIPRDMIITYYNEYTTTLLLNP
jgi:hypothetical protein